MRRLDIDQYFMTIAMSASLRSTCKRAKVGAVLVDDDHRLISIGYVGAASKEPHCLQIGCRLQTTTSGSINCIRTVHAEMNAILQAPRGLKHLRIYSTHFPCSRCLKHLRNFFVTRIFYWKPYPTEPDMDLRDSLLRHFTVQHVTLLQPFEQASQTLLEDLEHDE